jgi:hypothetical protein
MSFTRFRDDPDRIRKQLQQSTDVGRYVLNVPGQGDKPMYAEDPYLRAQLWAGNIMTNSVDIETELRGLSRTLSRDTPDNFHHAIRASQATRVNEMIACPTRAGSAVEQTRATHPAWMLRDMEQDNWKMLHFDPQEHVFRPFNNNLSTRIIEKDNFKPRMDVPGLADDTYFTVHPTNLNPELGGMVAGRRVTERGLDDAGAGTGAGTGAGIMDIGDMRQFSGTSALFS